MKSILEHIKGLNKKDWNYYGKELEQPFSNDFQKENISKFIKSYFEHSGKLKVYEKFIDADIDRLTHSTSLFFLGCILYENLNFKDKERFIFNNHDHFYFLWFLTTLSHDFTSHKEKDITKKDELIPLVEKLIKPDLSKSQETIPQLYKHIMNYFDYRSSDGKLDHGIVAGAKLFSLLVENREINKRNTEENRSRLGDDFDESKHLYWGDDLDPVYHYICIAIATHNMWLASETLQKTLKEVEEEYKKFGMEDLIEENFTKVSHSDNFLYVILCIIDTIDPIKEFTKDNKREVINILENIFIEFENKNTIILQNKNPMFDNFDKLQQDANNLKKWLNVDVEIKTEPNSIKIVLL